MTTAPTMTATDLALEMAMAIHLSAGNLLDQGHSMESVQQAIRKAADLLPALEQTEGN